MYGHKKMLKELNIQIVGQSEMPPYVEAEVNACTASDCQPGVM
jgi:hypothetical protein